MNNSTSALMDNCTSNSLLDCSSSTHSSHPTTLITTTSSCEARKSDILITHSTYHKPLHQFRIKSTTESGILDEIDNVVQELENLNFWDQEGIMIQEYNESFEDYEEIPNCTVMYYQDQMQQEYEEADKLFWEKENQFLRTSKNTTLTPH